MSRDVRKIQGEFWFSASYAAKLLGTVRKKIEAMAVRELIRSISDDNTLMVAESDVTFLRHNPVELKAAKDGAKMPAYPRRGETMPMPTNYVRDGHSAELTAPRIGHPLKDPKQA